MTGNRLVAGDVVPAARSRMRSSRTALSAPLRARCAAGSGRERSRALAVAAPVACRGDGGLARMREQVPSFRASPHGPRPASQRRSTRSHERAWPASAPSTTRDALASAVRSRSRSARRTPRPDRGEKRRLDSTAVDGRRRRCREGQRERDRPCCAPACHASRRRLRSPSAPGDPHRSLGAAGASAPLPALEPRRVGSGSARRAAAYHAPELCDGGRLLLVASAVAAIASPSVRG